MGGLHHIHILTLYVTKKIVTIKKKKLKEDKHMII
jgi:hypothetical protein